MIKAYMPNALMCALTDIIKVHPSTTQVGSMSETELRQLLRRIGSCSAEEIPALAYTLVRREVFAICKYISLNRYKVELGKLFTILNLRMTASLYKELFLQWQKYPDNSLILKLLAENFSDANLSMLTRLNPDAFRKWLNSSDFYLEIALYVSEKQGPLFEEKYTEAGLSSGLPLYNFCYGVYLSLAPFSQLLQEGEARIVRCAKKLSTEGAEAAMLHLLACGNSNRNVLVNKFETCFDLMFTMWRAPYAHRFPKEQLIPFKVYSWWYNYTEMTQSFKLDKDPRRTQFWLQYLDRCEVNRISTLRMIIFYFSSFCALDFEDVGPLYIFEKSYFKNDALPKIINTSPANAKSWLRYSSTPLYTKMHLGHWESDAAAALRRFL